MSQAWGGSGGEPAGATLNDGLYTLGVNAADVESQGTTTTMTSSYNSAEFDRLYGDFNNKDQVSAQAYIGFLNAFSNSVGFAGYKQYFDYNGDGKVAAVDYIQFKNRFTGTGTFVFTGIDGH